MTVQMTRRVRFSSGHRYWDPSLDREANVRLFGPTASPFNHGHNYVLDVTVGGSVDPTNGMIVNIKVIDKVLKERVVARLDNRSLNDEVQGIDPVSPTTERLAAWIRDAIQHDLPDSSPLVALTLEESPGFQVALPAHGTMIELTRTYEFAAAHRLNSPSLAPDENIRLYGKCNHEAGHGHNYVLEVTVGGMPDDTSGQVVDIVALDAAVEEEVLVRYDHRNLDVDVPELQGGPTTSERVSAAIFARLDGRLPAKLVQVRLWETARNAFTVRPSA